MSYIASTGMKLSLSPRVDAKPYGSVLLRLFSHGVQYIHMEIFNRIEYLPHHARKDSLISLRLEAEGFTLDMISRAHDRKQTSRGL